MAIRKTIKGLEQELKEAVERERELDTQLDREREDRAQMLLKLDEALGSREQHDRVLDNEFSPGFGRVKKQPTFGALLRRVYELVDRTSRYEIRRDARVNALERENARLWRIVRVAFHDPEVMRPKVNIIRYNPHDYGNGRPPEEDLFNPSRN